MTFVEKLDYLIKQKGISRNQLLSEVELGRNSFVNWSKRGSLPNGETITTLAQYFNVSSDYLLGLDVIPNRQANQEQNAQISSARTSTHDRAFDFIKYRIGREDAEFMFKAADIPIENSEYEMSAKVLSWIAAHCGLNSSYLCMKSPIFISDLEGTPYYVQEPEDLEELLKDPEIEIFENKYIIAKYEKYSKIVEEKHWDTNRNLLKEIRQGFLNLINRFKGDIGAQFALLDRCRQAADQLFEERKKWKAEEEALQKEQA